jgi:membrane protein insertase Oxa1/YidC/SpoIIIJ
MYIAIALLTFVLWTIGMVSGNTMSGFIHVFLVLSILTALLRMLSPGRSVFVFKTEHLKNSFRQYTPSNVLALTLLAIGLMFMLFGVSRMNTEGAPFDQTLMMFVAGIVGTSVGFIGLLRAPHTP